MNVGECCNREVVYASRDTTVIEAARLMRWHHVGDVVVVDERNGSKFPVGIKLRGFSDPAVAAARRWIRASGNRERIALLADDSFVSAWNGRCNLGMQDWLDRYGPSPVR